MRLPKQIWDTKVNRFLFDGDGRFGDHIHRKDKKMIRKIKRNIIKKETFKEIKEADL